MYKSYFGLILLLFVAACQPRLLPTEAGATSTPLSTTEPPPATEAPVTEVSVSGAGISNDGVLRIDGLNRVPPADIIQEIGFFGGAGGAGEECYDAQGRDPVFWSLPEGSSELMRYIEIEICNLQPEEAVNILVERPDGESIEEQATADSFMSATPFVTYDYLPLANDSPGVYTFTFSGAAWSLEYSHTVEEPVEARVYDYESRLYFLGFAPNERVRVLVYMSPPSDPSNTNDMSWVGKARFTGWTEYQMDERGRKQVELDIDFGTYVAIGEESGSVNGTLPGMESRTEPYSVHCPGAPNPVGLKPYGYAEVLVDSLPGFQYNSYSADWEKAGEFPIEKGSIVTIESNSRCLNNSFLWALECKDAACQYFVPEAGPEGAYFRPLEELPPTNTPDPSEIPVCAGTLPTRLQTGMNAEVTLSGMAPQLSLRAQPSMTAEKVHVIAAGRDMVILQGPVCADNSYWWYIRSEQGFEGWAREGDHEDYWIDPLP